MIKTKEICRVCSSRADYDIFSVIPAYLHASPNEFLQWTDNISKILEETTGLIVSPDDGLPQKMCAICISYLKHAATFRQQAINNTLSLKAVQMMSNKKTNKIAINGDNIDVIKDDNDKCIDPVTINDLIFNNTRKTDTNSLVNNVFNNQNKTNEYFKKFLILNDDKTQNNIKVNNDIDQQYTADTSTNLSSYLNLLFDKTTQKVPNTNRTLTNEQSTNKRMYNKNESQLETFVHNFFDNNDANGDEFQTASSDDNENYDQSMNFFSYKEKNFEEDDIMTMDFLKDTNVTINIPEHFKERKCRACFRRFMFEESYNEHMEICLEYKFLLLIEEINRLLAIRRSKAISPHEFIRRMIFSLKKTCQWLSTSCGEIFLPDLLSNGEIKKRTKSEGKSSGAENSSICRSDDNNRSIRENLEVLNKLEDVETSDSSLLNKTVIEMAKNNFVSNNNISKDNPLLKLLQEKADHSLIKNVSESPDPLLDQLKSKGRFAMSTPILKSRAKSDGAASDSSVSYTNSEKFFNNRTQRLHAIPLNVEIERKSLLESFNKVASKESIATSVPYIMPLAPMYPKLNFSARCNACDTIFESIASLEEHNAKFHNNSVQKIEKHKNIIALFESEDQQKEIEGTVDVIQILNCDPLKPNNDGKVGKPKNPVTCSSGVKDDMKTVRCKDCDKHFATIIHLDQHKLKFHSTMAAK